jgi:phage terminase large subunit GpA-like protein
MRSRSTLSIVAAALALGIAPDPVVVPSAWAASVLVVPDGPYAGTKWSPTVAPYLTEILDTLSPDDPSNRAAVRKSAQTGFTTIGIAWLGLIADMAPARVLAIQPTVDAAKEFNREKLQPAIEASPRLRRKIADQKSRSGQGSTMLTKIFPGGSISITGANSSVGLRSKTVRYALCDEVDDWPADLDGQGDPMRMVEARQMSFLATGRYKRFEISTPTLKGISRIDRAYEGGDQRLFHVPCPDCGEEQALTFENLRFEDAYPYNAHYICQANGCVIEHREKTGMLARGRWIAQAPGLGRYPSWHIDTLSSPFVTWNDIAKAFIESRNDPSADKTFTNLWLGRSYEIKGEAPEWEILQRRAQAIGSHAGGEVPAWMLFLTMGVDVQADRIEASVWGWGVGKVSGLVEHVVFAGDTNGPDVWIQLNDLWSREYTTSGGHNRRIECTAVDSGFRPTMTYDWTRGKPRTVSIKGYSGRTDWPIGQPKKMTYTPRGKVSKTSALNWMVGSWYLKAEIYGCLNLEGPDESGNFPPNFVHLPTGVDDELFKQLTAEKLITVQKRGGATSFEWQKAPQARNEVLDCAVYARAAGYHLGMGRMTLAQWEALAVERGAPPPASQMDLLRDLSGAATGRPTPAPPASYPPAQKKPQFRRSTWVR